MKSITFDQDIPVYCVTAASFPEGVRQAHEKLHSLVAFSPERRYFGLSWPDGRGSLVYKAAAEELIAGELSKHNLEPFALPAGQYLCEEVHNFMQNIPAIGQAFARLQTQPGLDPNAIGVEWYHSNNSCRCLMKLK